MRSNDFVLRFLLSLYHQGSEGQEATTSSLKTPTTTKDSFENKEATQQFLRDLKFFLKIHNRELYFGSPVSPDRLTRLLNCFFKIFSLLFLRFSVKIKLF